MTHSNLISGASLSTRHSPDGAQPANGKSVVILESAKPEEISRSAWQEFTFRFVSTALKARLYLLAAAHAAVFALSFLLAYLLRFDFRIPLIEQRYLLPSMTLVVVIKLTCFYVFRSFHGW